MYPLDEASRRRMFAWSAVLCAIPLCLAPLAGRSSFEVAGERARFEARFSAPALEVTWHRHSVNVARDPFAVEKPVEGGPVTAAGVVGVHVTQGQAIGYTVPGHGGAVRVTAVVTGVSPRALIDEGSGVRIVGVGDTLSGARIVGIDASGVHLQHGTLLALAQGAL